MNIFIYSLFSSLACTPDSAIFTSDFLSYAVHTTGDPDDLVYTQQYTLSEGRVVSEEYTNYLNPEYNHSSSFSYDKDGRVVEENQDGEITTISWEEGTARVYRSDGELFSQLEMDGERILTETTYNGNEQPTVTSFEYDDDGNVITIESPPGDLKTSFFEYDTTQMYPLHLIRSISILRMSYRAHFQHIFSIEQEQPFEGDDFSVGLADYQYTYTFDDQDHVETIQNEKSMNYTQRFSYK